MKHPVQNDTKTTTENAPESGQQAPSQPQTCPKGHCGKAGHEHASKVHQFTITITPNVPCAVRVGPAQAGPYARQMAILQELGFKRKGVCMAFLKKNDGDVGKAAEQLFAFRRNRQQRAADTAALADDAATKYAAEIAALEAKGFKCKNALVRLLTRFEGDSAKVEEILEKRRAQRQQRVAAKEAASVSDTAVAPVSAEEPTAEEPKEVIPEQPVEGVAEEEKAEAAPAVVSLNEEELRAKLMEKFNGNVATVDRVMARRKAQAERKQQQMQNKVKARQMSKQQRIQLKQERQKAKQAARQQKLAEKKAAKEARLAKQAVAAEQPAAC
eukprot:CAMPEP_0114611476 /NCGR_PEP_ID=MMETSP0168-20121206/4136_1 /TAXON_ID=95228 ORGANISM="Vannella sp., Strain DIVA3 517/6/12" /NCGR_SAMPLE_ID=MMETSP0168 /ASSEMBLY_ACC=CAM_ASM_000044 /LENGTH=327 /DNA_ID=CAMNT_0001822451 /DNA_START=11 /DNA_END=994 /DNA_ORIENTATION=+